MTQPEPQRTARRGSAADVARHAIEQAEQEGVERAQMILRLTLRDASGNVSKPASLRFTIIPG